MTNKPKILVVENHQIFIDGLLNSLHKLGHTNVFSETTCDAAYRKIKSQMLNDPFDILLTDLSFENTSEYQSLKSGEELIKKLQKEGLDIKIIVISGHSETNRVFNVIQNLNPDGYLLKNDCDASELGQAIKKVFDGGRFYSHDIHQKILRRNVVQIQLDETAIHILKELPNHPKISNLEGVIKKANGDNLKLRSIESKISNLRIDLGANNNIDLLLKAKELGII